MSAQNSAGIQTLLDAEKDASRIVEEARNFRIKRVKQARDEAKKEIEEYRTSKESEFNKFEAEHTKGHKASEEDADKEADVKIQEIKQQGQKAKAEVVSDLVKAVLEVNPVAPASA